MKGVLFLCLCRHVIAQFNKKQSQFFELST